MKKSILSIALAASVTAGLATTAEACTNFNFTAENGNTFVGRTMEWPGELNAQIAVVPRNHKFSESKTKYGFVGIQHGEELFSSALNEHGLSGEALALAQASFAGEGEGKIRSGDVVRFVLANAKNVEEAIALLKKTKVSVAAYDVVDGLHLGMHYAFNDGKKAIVVEYVDGSGFPVITKNTLGVLTNDPTYDQQTELAMMLLDGTGYDDAQIKFSEGKFAAFDYSPVGRFQKMVAFNYTQDLGLVKSDYDAVNRAWTMINAVDIPQGSLYWRFAAAETPQFTSYSNVVDIANKDYYFRTYDNMDVRKIDVDSIDFGKVSFKSEGIFRTADSYSNYVFK
ncbi:linear amide C-N hydrolase [Paraferrimonas sedimenticola]|uniref:Choloylglycine hydrolase n=1 Tax=Paraferrimonas sedimenticola TaxID=375674 RepID=A0AA37RWJ1_9GAMM|nr:linear amide C-N hydrolase [Paraferrimonas sedimenticola]GLP96239.1 choloylglycine hydrolase [Paraferrimonas sedimenticola]